MPDTKGPILTPAQRSSSVELKWVDDFSQLLDTKYRIPGTNVRFGVDFLLGLFPGVGDFISLAMSGLLIATMAKHGASARLVIRMLLNVVLDAVVGSVPVLGNVFDLFYKANLRNAQLMREYYVAGKHRGRVWPIVLGVLVSMAVIIIGALVFLVIAVRWLVQQAFG